MPQQGRRGAAGDSQGASPHSHAPKPFALDPWPEVEYGRADWRPRFDEHWSSTQRRANTGSFRYAITPRIGDRTPVVSPQATADAREATAVAQRFDAQAPTWGIPFASVLLRSESAASSQIERLTASARRIALADLGASGSPNATMISRNGQALRAAIDAADDLSVDAILAMHEALDGGDIPDDAGSLRDEWVWVGGRSPVTADFVGVHRNQVRQALEDMIEFATRNDLEPLTQAAIAHAHFETIHPFTDGNGRVGRALVSAILRRRDVTREMSLPVSSGLLSDTESYFAALNAYRNGDPSAIVSRFAQATRFAVENASVLRDEVAQVRQAVLATARRRSASLELMADICAQEPAFSAQLLIQRGLAQATAYRLAKQLTNARLLRSEHSIGGLRVWSVTGLTEALDDFARRAGRRSPRG